MTAPIVDRNRCEGKAACLEICPNNVFEVRAISAEERRSLTLVGKLKAWVHGGQQAYTKSLQSTSKLPYRSNCMEAPATTDTISPILKYISLYNAMHTVTHTW